MTYMHSFVRTHRTLPGIFLVLLLLLLGITGVSMGQNLQYNQGLQHFKQGDIDAAIPYFERSLETDSLHRPSYIYLTTAYLKSRQITMALSTADAGLHRFPDSPDLLWLKAEALLQERRHLEARSTLRRLQETLSGDTQFRQLKISRQQIDSRLASTWQKQGALQLRRGQPDSAAKSFDKALNLQPDSLQHYINLAYANLQREAWDQALEVANEGLDRFPDNGKLIKIKSRALYKQKDIGQLLKQYEKLHKKHPEDIEIALTYGQLLRADGQPQKAAKYFDQLLKEHPKNVRIYQALLKMNERSRNYEGQVEILKRMRRHFPDADSLTRKLAITYEHLREWGNARQAYDSLLTLTGDSLRIRQKIAETYREQDSLAKAGAILNELHRRHPDNTDLMRRLGKIYEEAKNWDKAAGLYEEWVRRDTTQYGLIHLGMAYQNTGRTEQARQQYEAAIRRGSSHPRPHLELSQIVYEQQPDRSFRLAVNALETSFQRLYEIQQKIKGQLKSDQGLAGGGNPEMSRRFETYNQLSEQAYRHLTTRYKPERVLPVLQKMTGRYSNSGRLHFMVGEYYEKQGQIDKAVDRYRKAIQVNDQIRGAHLALARYYEQQNQTRKAIRSYENALTLDPKDPKPYGKLIDLYKKVGQLDHLCDRWKARYESHVDNKVLREHLIEALHKANRFKEASNIVN